MKIPYTILTSILLVCTIQTASFAQSANLTETFKNHFNETVQKVQDTDKADEKRVILNKSFNKMITTIDRIESLATFTDDESAELASYKFSLTEIQSELNGLDGFDEIMDEDLDAFSNFSQDFIEQANRTVSIGVTTAILIVLLLLLL